MEVHPAIYTIGKGILMIVFYGLVLRVAVQQNARFKLNIWHAFGFTIITMIVYLVALFLLLAGLIFVSVDIKQFSGLTIDIIKMAVGFCVAIPVYMRIIHHPETGPLKFKSAFHVALALLLVEFVLFISRMAYETVLWGWDV